MCSTLMTMRRGMLAIELLEERIARTSNAARSLQELTARLEAERNHVWLAEFGSPHPRSPAGYPGFLQVRTLLENGSTIPRPMRNSRGPGVQDNSYGSLMTTRLSLALGLLDEEIDRTVYALQRARAAGAAPTVAQATAHLETERDYVQRWCAELRRSHS